MVGTGGYQQVRHLVLDEARIFSQLPVAVSTRKYTPVPDSRSSVEIPYRPRIQAYRSRPQKQEERRRRGNLPASHCLQATDIVDRYMNQKNIIPDGALRGTGSISNHSPDWGTGRTRQKR